MYVYDARYTRYEAVEVGNNVKCDFTGVKKAIEYKKKSYTMIMFLKDYSLRALTFDTKSNPYHFKQFKYA
jgi:hypothetical protein